MKDFGMSIVMRDADGGRSITLNGGYDNELQFGERYYYTSDSFPGQKFKQVIVPLDFEHKDILTLGKLPSK